MSNLTEREQAYFGPRADKQPGSVAWCWQTIMLMQTRWEQKTLDETRFQALCEELTQVEAWNVVPPEQPYGSLEALLQAEIGYGEQEARRQLVARKTYKGERTDIDESAMLSQQGRAQRNRVGLTKQKELDYLACHAPALLAAVQAGTMSAHRAYKDAKGVPKLTPLDYLHRYWRQVCPDVRVRFLIEMLTPAERRALSLGLDGDEEAPHA